MRKKPGEPDSPFTFVTGVLSGTYPASSDPLSNQCPKVLVEVVIPDHEWKFLFRVPTNTPVRELLRRVFTLCHLDTVKYVNYGLYLPPEGSKKGKFLQEERLLLEYPQLNCSSIDLANDSCLSKPSESEALEQPATLLLIRKCRYIDGLPLTLNKFKRVNTKDHQNRLMDAIRSRNIERISNLLDRGMDPNFQCSSTGETPLGYAASLQMTSDIIFKLVEKGACLEFRDVETFTPLHRAATNGNLDGIKALLNLGISPNLRDSEDLTPLYRAVSLGVPTECTAQLLYDHAILGVTDDKGRQEIHQACLFDRPKHLEQLINYGADLDAQTTNLDTPLHVCALNNHETCLQMLLDHGANRTLMNSSGQTPSEVAILVGHEQLAEIIDRSQSEEAVSVHKIPAYNTDRKPSLTGPRAALEVHRSRMSPQPFPALPLNRSASSIQLPQFQKSKDYISSTESPTTKVKQYIARSMSFKRLHSAPENSDGTRQKNLTVLVKNLRCVTIRRGLSGFGFRIRGQRDSIEDLTDNELPATQYFDDIDQDSPASEVGLQKGDYILKVNGLDVRAASHERVKNMIIQSGSTVTLTVSNIESIFSKKNPRNGPYIADRRQTFRRSRSLDVDSGLSAAEIIVKCSNVSAIGESGNRFPTDVTSQKPPPVPRSRLSKHTSSQLVERTQRDLYQTSTSTSSITEISQNSLRLQSPDGLEPQSASLTHFDSLNSRVSSVLKVSLPSVTLVNHNDTEPQMSQLRPVEAESKSKLLSGVQLGVQDSQDFVDAEHRNE